MSNQIPPNEFHSPTETANPLSSSNLLPKNDLSHPNPQPNHEFPNSSDASVADTEPDLEPSAPGWDSDLSSLSDPDDEGESDMDSSPDFESAMVRFFTFS